MFARFIMASMLLLAGGFCAGDDKKDDKKDDKDRLQGEWVVVSAEIGGREAVGIKGAKLVVTEDRWMAPTGDTFKFQLDATTSPKQLDLVRGENGAEQTWQGIYKITGDTLTFCRSQGPGGERPKEFNGGRGAALMVLKRAGK